MHYEKVVIQKPDLDTCLTGLICGVKKNDNIVVINHDADDTYLYDTDVLCIEVGGSGMVDYNNFDHHDPDRYLPPACRQAYEKFGLCDDKLFRLVEYVCLVDDRLPFDNTPEFPSLSNLFSGMLLVVSDKKTQFIQGMEILVTVLQEGIDPFGTMPDLPDWLVYKTAKIENQMKLSDVLANIKVYKSSSGLIIGYLQTDVIGGGETIYAKGCDIAVLYNPRFGNPPIPKYTIAGNNKRVGHLVKILDSIENGWGGRTTIIGSPRTGTTIKPDDLINLLIKNL